MRWLAADMAWVSRLLCVDNEHLALEVWRDWTLGYNFFRFLLRAPFRLGSLLAFRLLDAVYLSSMVLQSSLIFEWLLALVADESTGFLFLLLDNPSLLLSSLLSDWNDFFLLWIRFLAPKQFNILVKLLHRIDWSEEVGTTFIFEIFWHFVGRERLPGLMSTRFIAILFEQVFVDEELVAYGT